MMGLCPCWGKENPKETVSEDRCDVHARTRACVCVCEGDGIDHLRLESFICALMCPGGSVVNNPPASARDARAKFDLWVGKIPWRRKWQSTPVFLPEKSNGRWSLAGYSLWGHRVGHN